MANPTPGSQSTPGNPSTPASPSTPTPGNPAAPAAPPAKQSRLGRGLSSLIGRPVSVTPPSSAPASQAPAATPATQPPNAPPAPSTPPAGSTANTPTPPALAKPAQRPFTPPENIINSDLGITYISVGAIVPNPHQPRQRFDEGALKHLAASIKSDGLMQPIVVRPASAQTLAKAAQQGGPAALPGAGAGAGGKKIAYEIVAGERRWRAVQLVGLAVIPAVVRELSDRQVAEWALVENLQREDLNPLERAEAFDRLIRNFNVSQDEVATNLGIDRSSVSNHLRLLSLDKDVQRLIGEGLLSAGQAKALITVADLAKQRALAAQAVRHEWSVRQIEQAVRALAAGKPAPALTSDGRPTMAAVRAAAGRSAHYRDVETQISRQIGGLKVKLRPSRKKGSGVVTIDFKSIEEFDRLMDRLGVELEFDENAS